MAARTNIGYTITDSLTIGKTEFVIGENTDRSTTPYVTWACKNGDNYFWGHYLNSRREAEQDLVDRARDELNLLATIEARGEHQPKSKEHER